MQYKLHSTITEAQPHRMGWVGRDLGDHPASTPAVGRLPPPAQGAQGLMHGLGYLQGWGLS